MFIFREVKERRVWRNEELRQARLDEEFAKNEGTPECLFHQTC